MNGRSSGGGSSGIVSGGRSGSRVVWILAVLVAAFVAAVAVVSTTASPLKAQDGNGGWQIKEPPLTTPWTNDVSPENALPEYPRPQMVRDDWENLNGVWQFAGAREGEAAPVGEELEERILVPYPVESALSGIERHEDRMFYRRTFEVPKDWRIGKEERLVINFGAVDYLSTVWVNGERVGGHRGGYDKFSFDVTDALNKRGEQEIIVGVTDLTDRGNTPFGRPYVGSGQPIGKQTLRPGGIFYTANSGIWQTVWMEPVSEAHIERVDTTPDLENDTLKLTAVAEDADGMQVEATAYEGDREVASVTGAANEELTLPVENPKLWSPDNPFLYDLEVRLIDERGGAGPNSDRRATARPGPGNPGAGKPDKPGKPGPGKPDKPGKPGPGKPGRPDKPGNPGPGKPGNPGGPGPGNPGQNGGVVDSVDAYFGMRSVSIEEGDDGRPRMMLNGEFLANVGTLDQGYWPDGVYTAPTDEALKFDLQAHKDLGYNMVRKHIKVEPDRWFYHADTLGLIVWQDMPSFSPTYDPNERDQAQFEDEFKEIIDEHRSFPSVTTWVPYNEGWGELDQETTARVADMVKEYDPSRLVNAHSGVNCCESEGDSGAGDIYDEHNYQDPPLPSPFDDRATVAGEYGGVALQPAPENEFDPALTVAPYGAEPTPEALTERYEELQGRLEQGVKSCGVSAGVYTEITDLEGEINGMYTYDRQVFKPSSMERIRAANEAVIAASDDAGTGQSFPPGTPGIDGISSYPFSEGSGEITADAVGDNDATLVGPPAWGEGQSGSGLSFDGDDLVDTNDSVLDTSGNYSVAAWVKLDDKNSFQTAVSQDGDRQSAFFLQYSVADDRLAFSFANTRALSETSPEVGRWYHMVGVRDAENGQLKLYVDGQLAGTSGACIGDTSEGNTVIGRGKFNGDPVDYWRGDLDQIHLYDRAITDEEAAELYESGE